MGFNIEVNSILRSDENYKLETGAILPFEKSGSRIFFDNIPVWLTDKQWKVLAEISIVRQEREDGILRGDFRVDYIYEGAEQQAVTNMFIRMYDGLFDDKIYVLSSRAEYDLAMASGALVRDSLESVGFIHASPRSQLNRVANKFYRQVNQPLIMVVEKARVIPEIKWEPATGGLYPHIYGPMNMDSVVRTVPVALNAAGVFDIDEASL